MLMRIATFHARPDVDPARLEEFRAWMAAQPGLRSLYHVHDPASGRVLSVSVWESREAMVALKDRRFPGPPLALKPDEVAVYDVESAHERGAVVRT
jgi:hypothetical protein